MRPVRRGDLAESLSRRHIRDVDKDTEATQLMLEALFEIKVAVYEIRDYLIGDEDGPEAEEEEDS